jgi:hypothetical protein
MVVALKDSLERAGVSNAGAMAASLNAGTLFHRGEFFAGLFILGFVNAIFHRITSSITEGSVWSAISTTFGVSILVWAACWIAVLLLVRLPVEPVTRNDLIIGSAVTAGVLFPTAPASWIALTGLGLYLLRCFDSGSLGRRAGFVILAVTVPMLWSRLVFTMLSGLILQADAILVSTIVGTERVGNTLKFADADDYLYIAPACSSLANVSLAVLGWVLFTQALTRRPSLKDVWWGLAACSAVVMINVTRIGLIGLHREQYELIHGPIGSNIASFLTLAAIIGINLIRVRGDILTHP